MSIVTNLGIKNPQEVDRRPFMIHLVQEFVRLHKPLEDLSDKEVHVVIELHYPVRVESVIVQNWW